MENFLYDKEYASDYKLKPCYFNTSGSDASDTISQLSTDQTNIVGTNEFVTINPTYSSAFTIEFELGKFNCDDNTDNIITPEEYSKINRWLNRRENHKFKIYKDGYEDIYYMGRFNISPIKINNDIYGIKCTFISNYPYGFIEDITQTFVVNDISSTKANSQFSIYNHSDEIGDALPNIVIEFKQDVSKFVLKNDQDNEICEINNCVNGEIITIDSHYRTFSTNKAIHKLNNDFNYNFPKLVSTYENKMNIYTVNANVTITISQRPVRKAGF